MKCKCCGACALPIVFRLKGCVIWGIWFEVILCTLYAAGLVCVDMYYCHEFFEKYRLPDNIFSVVGVATGLLLVFRTDTSYDRYYEGRKIWSDMTSNIRTLIRTFWVLINDKNSPKLMVEKMSAVNLLVAFAYATKHYLREEYSYEEDDFLEFAGHLPHLLTPTSQEPLEQQEALRAILEGKAKRSKSDVRTDTKGLPPNKTPTLKKSLSQMKKYSSVSDWENGNLVGSNVPLEISFYLSSYVSSCKDRGMIDPATCRVVDTAICNLVSCLTSFERIRQTPIPIAYRVHLTQVTWIVLLLLPIQWTHIGWMAIPLMTLVSFSMLGILAIGKEIEDPFGYDFNDLNLEELCQLIHKEALVVTSVPVPSHEQWMFSEDNFPIIDNPNLNAADLVKLKPAELQRLLFAGKNFQLTEKKSAKVLNPNSELAPDEFEIIHKTV